jgi:hypothetical protein
MLHFRDSPRRRTLKGGTIFFHALHPGIACVMMNLSGKGAKLKVDDIDWVPSRFDLLVDLDGRKVGCEVAWTRDNEIGVGFVGDWVQVRKPRIQSLQPTRPASGGLIRRRSERPIPTGRRLRSGASRVGVLLATLGGVYSRARRWRTRA